MRQIPKVIVLLESSRASGRNLLRGIAEFARQYGPWSMYWEPRGLGAVWPRLDPVEADGIILRDVDPVDEVVERGIPAVVVGHGRTEIPGLVNVVTHSEAIGHMGAEHLLDCGFRNFGYCGLARGDVAMAPWSQQRGESFSQRLQRAGFATHFYRPALPGKPESRPRKPPPSSRPSHPRPPSESCPGPERETLSQWLRSLPKPVGIMACNDDRAQQLAEACKLARLRVPDEVAILGVDNDELVCGLADPPMSSIELGFERAGYESARALDGLMRGGQPARMLLTVPATHVVARQSTDVIFLEDPQVVQALRFIRTRYARPTRVTEVAAAAALSRRVLEKRFRRLLGRSVLSEIRRVRVEQICRLLVETPQSVSQIASALGYDDVQHVARYFQREKGMTPLDYRRRFGRNA